MLNIHKLSRKPCDFAYKMYVLKHFYCKSSIYKDILLKCSLPSFQLINHIGVDMSHFIKYPGRQWAIVGYRYVHNK